MSLVGVVFSAQFPWLAGVVNLLFLVMIVLIAADWFLLSAGLRKAVTVKFPKESTKGAGVLRGPADHADAPLADAQADGQARREAQLDRAGRVRGMDFRYLGNSGLKVSEISYGNWLTHGSQVENDQAKACVRAALEAGITTFDTADIYANTKAESVLGEALEGERRESLEIFTKVYWPTGPGGPNDTGLSRKHIHESINASLKRLKTDYVDLYQAHRYDTETPLEETMEAFADVVRSGKALYIGVSRVDRGAAPGGPPRWPGSCASRSSRTSRSTACSGG